MFPYLSLKDTKEGVKLAVQLDGSRPRLFTADRDGAIRAAKFLKKRELTFFLHGSSLDHYDEYGVEVDLMEVIQSQWTQLLPPEPQQFYVLTIIRGKPVFHGKNPGVDPLCDMGSVRDLASKLKEAGEEPYIVEILPSGQLHCSLFEKRS